MISREQHFKNIEKLYKKGLEIIKLKNCDYASTDNPFQNFINSEIVGVPLARGILVRVMDKISRIETLLDKDPKVKDEKLEDTILDAINYLAILKSYLDTIK